MVSHSFPPDRSKSRGAMSGRLLLRCSVGNEERAECSDRDHDDCDGGFGLKPKYRPREVNLAMVDVSSGDFDDRCDCREDAEAQDPQSTSFRRRVILTFQIKITGMDMTAAFSMESIADREG